MTPNPGIGPGDGRCSVGAGVVDDEDFVGRSGLREQGKETGRKHRGFVIGADDRGDRQGRQSALCR